MDIIKNVKIAECKVSIVEFDNNLHSVEELTSLLHRSYKPLTNMGLHFVATSQSPARTLERLQAGIGLIAMKNKAIIGTICFYPTPYSYTEECTWYKRTDVGRFGQFAVDPGYQKLGLGRFMIEIVERIAIEHGKQHLALDTAEKAWHLIDYYKKLGFSYVEHIQWNDVNYRSVVMIKKLNNKI